MVMMDVIHDIKSIDNLINGCNAFSSTRENDQRLNRYFKTIAKAILNYLGKECNENDLVEKLFDPSNTIIERKFISSCMLRILSISEKMINNQELRHKIERLFDESLMDLYKVFKIDKKIQSYEKINLLRDIATTTEKKIQEVINSFSALSQGKIFRQDYLKALNSTSAQIIVWPFLPPQYNSIGSKDLTEEIEKTTREKLMGAMSFYERINEAVRIQSRNAELFGTDYSKRFISNLMLKYLEMVNAEIQANPFFKPANMEISKYEKKYPLWDGEKEILLALNVTNNGNGCAYDVMVEIEEFTDIEIKNKCISLGRFEPGELRLDLPGKVKTNTLQSIGCGRVTWKNYDKTTGSKEFYIIIESQKIDFDWANLSNMLPYSLEPVESDIELIGRDDMLAYLFSLVNSSNVGSCFLYGQKRVGKTSIVKTLRNKILSQNDSNYIPIYLERGDFAHPEPDKTIEQLGRRICQIISDRDKRFKSVPIPIFDRSLSPLTQYLDSLVSIVPSLKVLFIFDEFDELPLDLYKRGAVGDAFFGTLRTITGKPNYGIIVVGGENMDYILNFQGASLNKFVSQTVDYFDKSPHWRDFCNLVRQPISKWMEITDKGINLLYEYTAGNPFFTKLICARLFRMMVERRDNHITEIEIKTSIESAIKNDIALNKVAHFWTDGIFESSTRLEEISLQRRKVLLSIAESVDHESKANKDIIVKNAKELYAIDEASLEITIQDFIRRRILIKDDDIIKFKMPLLARWLIERGMTDVITSFSNLSEVLEKKKREEDQKIRPEEINSLIEKNIYYKGNMLSEERIKAWLNQFVDYPNQRLAFKLLQNIRYYGNSAIRLKLHEAHAIVTRGILTKLEQGKRKRGDILVSYHDHIAKSGCTYANLYADENGIYIENIIEKGKIGEKIENFKKNDIQALVFIDDFIGTGNSAKEYLSEIYNTHRISIETSKIKVFFIAIAGYVVGKENIDREMEKIGFDIKIHICDPLTDVDQAFNPMSTIFQSEKDRLAIQNLSITWGTKLEPRQPLGYGGCQSLVVFENSCPNNTLPIFWSEDYSWYPLFKRH
jgi:hypothetical protein